MKANPCEGEGRDIGDGDRALGRKQREKGGSCGQEGRATSRNHGAEKPPDWQMGLTYCAACAQSGVRPGEAAVGGAQTTVGAGGVCFHNHLTVFLNKV